MRDGLLVIRRYDALDGMATCELSVRLSARAIRRRLGARAADRRSSPRIRQDGTSLLAQASRADICEQVSDLSPLQLVRRGATKEARSRSVFKLTPMLSRGFACSVL